MLQILLSEIQLVLVMAPFPPQIPSPCHQGMERNSDSGSQKHPDETGASHGWFRGLGLLLLLM